MTAQLGKIVIADLEKAADATGTRLDL